jgi:hypothetical protein
MRSVFARQRRQALDLLGVGDQHLPAVLLERVVHEPRAVHRLDYATHVAPERPHPPHQAAEAISVRRRRDVIDQLTVLGEQADIEPMTAEIQSSVQHEHGPPRARSPVTR